VCAPLEASGADRWLTAPSAEPATVPTDFLKELSQMPRPSRILAVLLGVLALVLAGCGSVPEGAIEANPSACPKDSSCYDPPRAVGEGSSFTIDAKEFEFFNMQGVAIEGDVQVTLENKGQAEHNIFIEGANEGSATDKDMTTQPGQSTTGTFNLFAGEYTFYCTVPGHRQAGMEGTLTVYASMAEAEAAGALDTASPSPSDTGTGSEAGATASPSPTDTAATTEPTATETAASESPSPTPTST
jgi:nitrite reductase (NO-forming)